ncbi:ATP-dependent helicase [Vibrio parahaemolyticus]|nr:ATP-dependent helicase [Vibrio parahaemolyticus]EHH3736343.1 ATP-dependent helicase [Vibrio parahaemolyticus]
MSDRLTEEAGVLQLIFDALEGGRSFRFSAGAGSGKTHALIECLKYLLKKNINKLGKNSQQIVCITYTNVAVDEIKERLGNSDAVIVSTIHEMLWELIRRYQPELVVIHLNKMKQELSKLEYDLSEDPDDKLGVFNSLSEEDRDSYIDLVRRTKSLYYLNRNARAGDFRSAYDQFKCEYGESNIIAWLRNCNKFQEVAKRIYKKDRYDYCIHKIESQDKDYTEVIYDNAFNTDRLDRMRFSHDTLLEYASILIDKYPVLRRLIIDKYPYFFVDEYQDANPYVIKVMRCLHSFSTENNRKWMVGYFGDTAQTIYDDGVGSQIGEIHSDIEIIYKKYNRRSQKQIIDIANTVRNDEIIQEPIFEDRVNGDVRFYRLDSVVNDESKLIIAKDFVNKFQQELGGESQVDCLVLTNKLMAEMNGFGEVYEAFKTADNIYFDDLNTKLLSHELDKLDPVIRIIFKLINSYLSINNETTTFYDVFGERGRSISFSEANEFLRSIRETNPTTLRVLLSSISDYYRGSSGSKPLEIFLRRCLGSKLDEIADYGSVESLVRGLLRDLMIIRNQNGDTLEDLEIEKVNQVLNIPIEIWSKWVKYINKENNTSIRYHTYHGTKGEEYKNVAIIMEHSFGSNHKGRNKFKKFFDFRGKPEDEQCRMLEDDSFNKQVSNTQNLVYVACSRAIENLWLIYLDDISDIESGVNLIFNDSIEWK